MNLSTQIIGSKKRVIYISKSIHENIHEKKKESSGGAVEFEGEKMANKQGKNKKN